MVALLPGTLRTDQPVQTKHTPDLDATSPVDAMVPEVEHVFDDDEGGPDAHRWTQKRHLTLLNGGVTSRSFDRPGAPVSTTFPVLRDVRQHDEPLRRYQREHTLPPLWSATATWTNLTHQHSVPGRRDMAAGWGHKWTLTYRHGSDDLTASVATTSTRDLLSADPVRVNSWHPNKTARAGLRYLHSTERHHAHESLFERKLLCVLDFDGVEEVVSQPFTLTWYDGTRVRHHTPDFLALIHGDVVVINTRPAERLNQRLIEDASALAEVCLSRGWGHALVTGYPLPAFTTVETVEAHARDTDRLGVADAVHRLLTEAGPTQFSDICRHVEGHVVARAIVQRLVWDRRVSLDLNRNLEDSTLISLPGQEPLR